MTKKLLIRGMVLSALALAVGGCVYTSPPYPDPDNYVYTYPANGYPSYIAGCPYYYGCY